MSAGFLYHGVLSTFERAGFREDRKIGKHRWVVTTTRICPESRDRKPVDGARTSSTARSSVRHQRSARHSYHRAIAVDIRPGSATNSPRCPAT